MLAADEEFDYVIVGGGTAGCVLANRLSANERTRVLLLEPGQSARGALKVTVPVALVKLFNSEWDWSFKAHPRAESNLRANIHLARGRALGGSSATNALLYHRGTAEDFDAWACDGWGSAEMLRAFKRVEGQRRRTLRSSPFHSSSGPVSVEDARYTNSLSTRFVEAAVAQGHARRDDFNDWAEGQDGVGKFQLQTRRGRRVHAAASHLRPALRRPNLEVLTTYYLLLTTYYLLLTTYYLLLTPTQPGGTYYLLLTTYYLLLTTYYLLLTTYYLRRPNLEVRTSVRVTRVLLDEPHDSGKAAARAVGVAYVDEAAGGGGDAERRVALRAGGEVVLCAGAVGIFSSPNPNP